LGGELASLLRAGFRAAVRESVSIGVMASIEAETRAATVPALVGTSRSQMRRVAARTIASDPDHPLSFLLNGRGRFKPTRGLSHAELVDRPDLVQMGHIASNKLGGQERLMLQGAWENQINNLTIEAPRVGGAVLNQTAIDIGGIAVDLKTAQFWEKFGSLPGDTVQNAPRIP
jgi:hypothetical protein